MDGQDKILTEAIKLTNGRLIITMEDKVRDEKVLYRILSSRIREHNYEVNQEHNTYNNKKEDFFIHKKLFFTFLDGPNVYDQSQNTCNKIKVKKGHGFVFDMLDIITAILKNNIVKAAPATKVSHRTLLTAPGTNIPTTNEANMIFAPSRKKSETTFNSSLVDIHAKFTMELYFCQGNKIISHYLTG